MKAIVIGATGLVGKEIVRQALANAKFTEVSIFVRRQIGIRHEKLREHVVDFKKMPEWKNQIRGDIAFSALGTTRSQVGSIKSQYEVDYTYQAEFAKACSENGVSSFVLISSMGANEKSHVPYTKMKGELENYVKTLGFNSLHILRPGPLEGPREKRRTNEELMVPVAHLLSKLPFLKFIQPVTGERVAKTAIEFSLVKEPVRIVESAEVISGLNA